MLKKTGRLLFAIVLLCSCFSAAMEQEGLYEQISTEDLIALIDCFSQENPQFILIPYKKKTRHPEYADLHQLDH